MANPSNLLTLERRITFSQTDAAGLIHFTTYYTLMEEAEAELFRELGLTLISNDAGKVLGYPRIECQCKFRRPVGFDDLVRIELSIATILANRIQYAFQFYGPSGEKCASGTMTTAAATRDERGRLLGSDIPEAARSALESWKNQAN